jgi:hypothetical protein
MTELSDQLIKISETIEIAAPASVIFQIIATCERRLQFHSGWGKEKIIRISPDFPAPGSRYSQKAAREETPAFDTIVTACTPDREFAYFSENSRRSRVSWVIEEYGTGTRLTYEEEFISPELEVEESSKAVTLEVKDWITNIKRYTELGEARTHRFLKWLLDRYLLKMRADERRIILVLIAIQLVSILSFTAAILGLGLISLIF